MKTVNTCIGKLVLLIFLLSVTTSSFAQPTDSITVLNVTDLINFSGKWNENSVNLQCKLAQDHRITKVYIERSNSSQPFERIAEINTESTTGFNYNDADAPKGQNLYRIALYKNNSNLAYSKTLKMDNEMLTKLSFHVYPTVTTGSATLSISSTESGKGAIQIASMSGHILSQQAITLQQGTTVTDLEAVNTLNVGNYMVILTADTQRLVQRIIVSK